MLPNCFDQRERMATIQWNGATVKSGEVRKNTLFWHVTAWPLTERLGPYTAKRREVLGWRHPDLNTVHTGILPTI